MDLDDVFGGRPCPDEQPWAVRDPAQETVRDVLDIAARSPWGCPNGSARPGPSLCRDAR